MRTFNRRDLLSNLSCLAATGLLAACGVEDEDALDLGDDTDAAVDEPELGDPGILFEIDPGFDMAKYDITDANGNPIGQLLEMAKDDIVSGGHTWEGRHAYWKWDTAVPATFELHLAGYGALPSWAPDDATLVTTAGPFDTTTQYGPVSGGSWWSISKASGAVELDVGWLNRQPNGTQVWYESAPNMFITISATEELVFRSESAPTGSWYRRIDVPD